MWRFYQKGGESYRAQGFPLPFVMTSPSCALLIFLFIFTWLQDHVWAGLKWNILPATPRLHSVQRSWRPLPFLRSPSSHGHLISWSFTKCWSSSACFSSFLSKISLPRKAHPPLWLNPTSTLPTYGWLPISYPQLRFPTGAPDLCTPTCFVDLSTKISHKPLKPNIPQAHPYPVTIISVDTYWRSRIRNKKSGSPIHLLHL